MDVPVFRLPLMVAVCCFMVATTTTDVLADRAAPSEQTEIRAVIQQQLNAFSRDDANAAYAIASPMIQQMFGTAANFMAMVRQGYGQIYRHRRMEFGKLAQVNGEWVQLVVFTGSHGHKALAVYTMFKDAAGGWRIHGCRLLQKDEEAA